MKNILTGVFKRWICFIPALVFWLIATPFNLVFIFIPEGIYWFITGRSLIKDGDLFIKWVLKDN